MIYAGFWRRLGALLLDLVVLLPTLGIDYSGNYHYRLYDPYAVSPNLVFALFYNVYLVRRLGALRSSSSTGRSKQQFCATFRQLRSVRTPRLRAVSNPAYLKCHSQLS